MRARLVAVVATAAAALCAPLLVALPASAAVAPPVPVAPVTLPAAIEDLPAYQPQTFCDPVDKRGPVAFGALLTATYADTTVVDISRTCAADTSEQIWGTWSQSWQPYSCSGVTACHQDHVHFSFDWAGARKNTSFWTGTVGAPMAVPHYVYANSRFAQVVSVAARSKGVTTPFSLRAGVRYRFTVSGTYRPDATATADGECSSADGRSWRALAPGDVSAGTGRLDLWVRSHRSWVPTVRTGGGCNATGHTYTRTLTFATTVPVTLSINDAARADDKGSLKVTVQRV
jgi:hypothetical protein